MRKPTGLRAPDLVIPASPFAAEMVVAHNERATLRVGDVFLKIDADQTRTDVEVEAMAMAPIPTPEVLWRAARARTRRPPRDGTRSPRRAVDRVPGGVRRSRCRGTDAARRAPAAMAGRSLDVVASLLDGECEWLVTNGVLPTDLVARNRRIAEAALRPWTPVFTNGDLQISHVFVDGDEITVQLIGPSRTG